MAGRDVDTASFFQLANECPLVLLRGTSGAGKSTFLKLGLGRALHQSGQWLPIYVDSWRSDWQDGPWTTLFDALSLALRNLPENERTRIAAALSTGAESLSLLY
jgi:ABC-type thiamine transport system ATPase subunit